MKVLFQLNWIPWKSQKFTVLPACSKSRVVKESNVFPLHESVSVLVREECQCPTHLCPFSLQQMIWITPFTFSDYFRNTFKGHYQAIFPWHLDHNVIYYGQKQNKNSCIYTSRALCLFSAHTSSQCCRDYGFCGLKEMTRQPELPKRLLGP